jgi:hypothetical protein
VAETLRETPVREVVDLAAEQFHVRAAEPHAFHVEHDLPRCGTRRVDLLDDDVPGSAQ